MTFGRDLPGVGRTTGSGSWTTPTIGKLLSTRIGGSVGGGRLGRLGENVVVGELGILRDGAGGWVVETGGWVVGALGRLGDGVGRLGGCVFFWKRGSGFSLD